MDVQQCIESWLGGSTPPGALIGQGSIQQLGLFIDVTDVSLRTWNCESVALLRSSQPTSRTRENSRRSSVQRTGWGLYFDTLLQSFYFFKLDIFFISFLQEDCSFHYAMEKMSRPLPINPTFLPPTHGVLKSLLENPMKLPFHHDEGKDG